MWIPTSERLPDKNGDYLVSYSYLGEQELGIDEFRRGEWVETPRGYKVIAWAPLPKPYESD